MTLIMKDAVMATGLNTNKMGQVTLLKDTSISQMTGKWSLRTQGKYTSEYHLPVREAAVGCHFEKQDSGLEGPLG